MVRQESELRFYVADAVKRCEKGKTSKRKAEEYEMEVIELRAEEKNLNSEAEI